jgi:hypothetical protein
MAVTSTGVFGVEREKERRRESRKISQSKRKRGRFPAPFCSQA